MDRLRLGDFMVDPAAGEMVGPAGREQLDPKVMQVLVVLARHAGEVVPRQALLEAVWPAVVVGEDVVSRCIYQLRRHLRQAGGDERHAALVETLPKRGYRLNLPAVATAEAPANPPPAGRAPAHRRWLPVLGIGALLVVAASAFLHLRRSDAWWPDPLANARYTRVTDFDGVAPSVAISRDGQRIAFLASRDGRLDAWITKAGTGEFRNLTQGRVPEIDTPVRSLGFTPDGAQLVVWSRARDGVGNESIHTWAVRTDGGPPHPFLEHVAEVDWSPDGKRIVYHPAAPGDPLFVADADRRNSRQIYIAPKGVHCHFPLWSPDGRFIYFVQGRPPDDMDLWRIAAEGGEPERITFHATRVSYPAFLDDATLLYLATAKDGSGPWLYGIDTGRRVPHQLAQGLEQYTSLSASASGRRLVATRSMPRTSLWRVPITAGVATEADVRRIVLPAAGGQSPRLGPGYLLFVSPGDGGLRKASVAGDQLTELWSGRSGRVVAGPAIDPLGRRIAFSAATGERTRLHVIDADGRGLRTLAASLQVKGAPAWSPDGTAIIIAAGHDDDVRLFKVPVDGGPAVALAADYSRDATWSPDGRFLVFSGADVGPTFPVQGLSADGRPYPMPELALPRGARRMVFLPGGNALLVLKGAGHDRNFWLVDLRSGQERLLTRFGPGFAISDFDVAADGSAIVFDQQREESDVIQIDLARR